jgi:hypothetical protein
MDVLKNANLAIRFALELCMLAAFGWWGYHSYSGTEGILLAIGLPLVVAIIWGLFLSPKAKVKLPMFIRVLMELVLFGTAAWLLYNSGKAIVGEVFLLVFIVNRTILLLLKY